MKEVKIKKAYVLATERGWIDWSTGSETENLDLIHCTYASKKEAADFANEHGLNAENPEFCQVAAGYLLSDENDTPLTFEPEGAYLGENLAFFLGEILN